MKCSTCGSDNLEGTVYCDLCGTKLSPNGMPSPSATPTDAEAIQSIENARLILTATGNECLINKDVVLLGRESVPDNVFPEIDLTPDDPEGYVSRRHAQIQRQDKHYTIIDLGSTNGTFVNNKRLAEDTPHSLTNGDEIRVGKIVLKFLKDGEKIKNTVHKKRPRTSRSHKLRFSRSENVM